MEVEVEVEVEVLRRWRCELEEEVEVDLLVVCAKKSGGERCDQSPPVDPPRHRCHTAHCTFLYSQTNKIN